MQIKIRNDIYDSRGTVLIPYGYAKNLIFKVLETGTDTANILSLGNREIREVLKLNFPTLDDRHIRKMTVRQLVKVVTDFFNEALIEIAGTIREDKGRALAVTAYLDGYDEDGVIYYSDYLNINLGVVEDIMDIYARVNDVDINNVKLSDIDTDLVSQLFEDLEDVLLDTFDGITLVEIDTLSVIDIIRCIKDGVTYSTELLNGIKKADNPKN